MHVHMKPSCAVPFILLYNRVICGQGMPPPGVFSSLCDEKYKIMETVRFLLREMLDVEPYYIAAETPPPFVSLQCFRLSSLNPFITRYHFVH